VNFLWKRELLSVTLATAAAANTAARGKAPMELLAPDDPRVVALSVALAPYPWWSATPEMLARRAVAILDRHWLLNELPELQPGTPPTVTLRDTTPTDRSDERVAVLADCLRTLRWTALTRATLCRHLVSALQQWWLQRQFA
jgi:hypothetical protein